MAYHTLHAGACKSFKISHGDFGKEMEEWRFVFIQIGCEMVGNYSYSHQKVKSSANCHIVTQKGLWAVKRGHINANIHMEEGGRVNRVNMLSGKKAGNRRMRASYYTYNNSRKYK